MYEAIPNHLISALSYAVLLDAYQNARTQSWYKITRKRMCSFNNYMLPFGVISDHAYRLTKHRHMYECLDWIYY